MYTLKHQQQNPDPITAFFVHKPIAFPPQRQGLSPNSTVCQSIQETRQLKKNYYKNAWKAKQPFILGLPYHLSRKNLLHTCPPRLNASIAKYTIVEQSIMFNDFKKVP